MRQNSVKTIFSKLTEIPKPGWSAQQNMAPAHRLSLYKNFTIPSSAKQAAVMMLLYPNKKNEIHFCLIQRPDYQGTHAKQISFPGGKQDPTDGSLWNTALRETQEEVGVFKKHIELITSLSPTYIPPSNFIVHPFMAFLDHAPNFILQTREVEGVIEVPLHQLVNEASVKVRPVKTSYAPTMDVPMFVFDKQEVWGATAMILAEAKELILSLPDFRRK